MRRWVLGVLAVVVLAVALGSLAWFTPLLKVSEVTVEGNQRQPAEEIRAAAGVDPGENMLRVDTQSAAGRVAGLNWIKEATVHKQWPATVSIQVTERLAVLKVGDELIDAEGNRFHATDAPDTALEATGAGVADAEVARAVGTLDPEVLASMARVDAPSALEIKFFTKDGREIYWGSADLAHDKALATKTVLSREGQRWDVSNPHLVTVR